jgi:hypothetical protein
VPPLEWLMLSTEPANICVSTVVERIVMRLTPQARLRYQRIIRKAGTVPFVFVAFKQHAATIGMSTN